MPTLPAELLPFIVEFQPLFSKSVWKNAQTLLVGAILAIGKRTVTACLRVMGKSDDRHFQNYHRVLNRARWSALEASRLLLRLLLSTFAPTGELLFGLDDTIERRRGEKIKAKGIYRDPVRSSHSHFVKASGLRWLSCMLLTTVPWASAVWGLPFLTVLCPSERYYAKKKRRHQKMTERAWQVIALVARWLPDRALVFVADSSFAVFVLLGRAEPAQERQHDHEAANGRSVVRLRACAPAGSDGPPSHQRRAPPFARAALERSPDEVGEAGGRGLVWWRQAPGRGLQRDLPVGHHRQALRPDPLGPGARRAGRI